jgi:hypothetical protein
MNLQYSGTKKTLSKDRENAVKQFGTNKVDKARIDAVNDLVDAFLKDKSISDETTVSVNAVSSTTAISINVTLDQATVVNAPPQATESNSKPLTKSAEKAKQEANAKTVIKKVERIAPEDATDGNTAPPEK